jgi:integrase
LAELQRDKGAKKTGQTVAQHEAVFRLFSQFVGDAALDDISDEKASEFLQEVEKLHPHWGRSPETKKLTVWQILEKFGRGEERLTNTTLNRYVSSLRAVFKWARRRKVYKGPNPFAEQSYEKPSSKETMWKLYTTDELQKLMHAPSLLNCSYAERVRPKRHDMQSAMRWLPLLALFTGMRQGELCQMHASDIEQHEGIWVFRVHAERDGQRLKTEAAERIVPVHSELIRCGFIDYVRGLPSGQLFPGLKPGGPDGKLNTYVTKRFTAYRRSVGITRERVVFHSLRKNAAQALKNARTTPTEIAELIGHERGFTVETYAPLGLPVPVLKELVERIKYPRLDLRHLLAAEAKAKAA